MEEILLLSFESSNFAMQCETVLKSESLKVQVIPTPREITLSCGLSIITNIDNKDIILELIKNKKIRIKSLYRMKGSGKSKTIEEIGI